MSALADAHFSSLFVRSGNQQGTLFDHLTCPAGQGHRHGRGKTIMNSLESLVRRLGEETGLADLTLDAESGCTLMFDEQTVVEIRPNA
jgi:hypothetical protein